MRGDSLDDEHNTIRYIKPSSFEDGVIDGSGFPLRQGEKGISVNWLEFFEGSKEEQIQEIRQFKNRTMTLRKTGCFAELNVGQTRQYLAEEILEISFVEDPIEASENHEADPSHSLICGVPSEPDELRMAIQDMIAECITAKYPAKENI